MRFLLPLLLSACVIGQDKYPRPRDLSPAWLVDKTRILGIRAEPPEIAPGQTAFFEALLPQPEVDEPWPRLWFACPPEDPGGIGFGCNLDVGTVAGTGGTGALPEGFIGFEPGLPPVYTSEPDLLDDLTDPRELSEGKQVLVQVTALPPDVLENDVADVDFNEVELGYKRLVVSEATTPNLNPRIAEFVVDRWPVPEDTVVHVSAGQTYEPGVILEEVTIQDYEYLNRDGEVEERVEEPYAHWFATGGTILEEYTLYPYTESTWTAPDESGATGTWYAVVRDRRGGVVWASRNWVVD